MRPTWSEWKRYPKAARGEVLEAPIGPGVYEVRHMASGALFAFGAVDNIAQALAQLGNSSTPLMSWFGRRAPVTLPDLEYRTCATATRAEAKTVAARMVGRREAYLSGVA